ncbi:MAG TPA: GNAT family N-acetyltransferase [Bacillota bacterium]|nr:GNAT family N-acetyltransferase [Bacillota bacterium]
MIIRRAEPGDFLMLAELDRVGWGQNANSEFIPDGEHIWRFWVEYSSVFLAETEGKPAGTAVMYRANQGNLFMFHKLVIAENFRKQKLGQGLLRLLTQELDNYQADALLTVDPNNETMLHLCDKYGFSERDFIKGYYRSKEDRFLLRRRYKG